MRGLLGDRCWVWMSGLACLVYGLVMLVFNQAHHQSLGTYFDLAIFDQGVWLISQGAEPFVTVRGLPILGNHFSPILYLVAPLYRICDQVEVLLVLQTLALVAGAYPLYRLAEARLKEPRLAFLMVLAYLANPQLERMNLADFEPSLLATPLLLGALWNHERGGRWGYYACLLLALGCKQNVGLAVTGLGLVLGGRRGLVTAGLGLGGVALGSWVVEFFNRGQASCHLALYDHPGPLLLVQGERPLYFLKLLYPLAFLPLLCPVRLLPALPVALLNALSWKSRLFSAYFHYDAAIIPFLMWAAIGALERWRDQRAAAMMAGVALTSGLAVMVGFGLRTWNWPTPRDRWVVEQLRRHIPPTASVAAQSELLPQLSHRSELWLFPNPFRTACWGNTSASIMDMRGELPPAPLGSGPDFVVLLGDHSRWPLSDVAYDGALRQLLRDARYTRLVAQDGLLILRRRT